MLPSASDRRSWLVFGLVLAGLIGIVLLLGAGPWLTEKLGNSIRQLLEGITSVIAISLVLHVLLLVPVYILRKLINRYLFKPGKYI